MEKDIQYTKLLKQQLSTFQKEKRFLEFKSNYQDAEKLGRYISALSNGACLDNLDFGYLYFGVDNDTLEVKHTTFDCSKIKAAGNQQLEMYLRQLISPKIDFQIDEFKYEGKTRVVVFIIPAAQGEPTCFKNVPYVRVDSHTTDLRPYIDWMRQIYNSHKDWTKEIIPEASLSDLDEEAIKKARKGYIELHQEQEDEINRWDDAVFLDKARLTINGRITKTTLLLVGKAEAAHMLDHIAQIVWRLDTAEETAGETYTIPFLLSTSKVLNRIRNYKFKIFPNNSLIPSEIWKYDTRTILEGLHNCIAHQDYTANARIVVTERTEELVFSNRGAFFMGSYEDYIEGKKTPEKYRNPFLTQAMVSVHMIDTQGYGIHNMFLRQQKRYLPMPDYDLSDEKSTVLRVPGNVIDKAYSLMLIENTSIDLTTAYLLDKVQKGKDISPEAVAMLRKRKLVEGHKSHLYVSKYIAQATNQQIDYSLRKGYNDAECQEWIIRALKEHELLSRAQINELLWNKLPSDFDDKRKNTKIGNLLTKMRKAGIITTAEKKRWKLTDEFKRTLSENK